MSAGIRWGDDLESDCLELRKLESWGIYPTGEHDACCSLCLDRAIAAEEASA